MTQYSKRALLVNMFGTFGYLFGLALWMWAAVLCLPFLLNNPQVQHVLFPPAETPPVSAPVQELSPAVVFFGFAVTAVIMILTVLVLLRAPIMIAKTGKNATSKAADSLAPIITHGKPLPPAQKRRLTVTLIKIIKLVFILLPFIALVIVGAFAPLPLSYSIVVIVASVCAALSVFWFSAQYILANRLGVKPEKLV